jgi:hypothetical protein
MRRAEWACAYHTGDRRLSSDEALGFPLWVEVFDFGNLHHSIGCCFVLMLWIWHQRSASYSSHLDATTSVAQLALMQHGQLRTF